MPDCKNTSCPFRVNETSNKNNCESSGCENRYINSYGYIVTNRTVTDKEWKELHRRNTSCQLREKGEIPYDCRCAEGCDRRVLRGTPQWRKQDGRRHANCLKNGCMYVTRPKRRWRLGKMDDYIEHEAVIDLITRRYENPEICTAEINSIPAPMMPLRWCGVRTACTTKWVFA